MDGQDLSAFIKQTGFLTLDRATGILDDCSAALDYAHKRQLVHRDVKPSNILLRHKEDPADRERLQAVLTDFGLAKIENARTRLTTTGAMGSIDYMAPEQIKSASEVDQRADIYALGIVAYEMLTGERPFKGNAGQVLFAHLNQPLPDPRSVQPDIPDHISSAVKKALEKQPDERFQTAGEFATALKR